MNKVGKVSSAIAVLVLGLVLLYAASGAPPVSAQTVTGNLDADFVSNDANADNSVVITIFDGSIEGTGQTVTTTNPITVTTNHAELGGQTLTLQAVEIAPTKFVVTFEVIATATTGEELVPTIAASDGGQITVKYKSGPSTRTLLTDSGNFALIVDGSGPDLDSFSPADNTTTKDTQQILSVQVSDGGAGVGDEAAIKGGVDAATELFVMGNVFFSVGAQDLPPQTVTDLGDGVFTVTADVDVSGDFQWTVTAIDELGNQDVSDAFSVIVDIIGPSVVSAATGHGTKEVDVVDDVTDEVTVVVEDDPTANDLKSIVVIFNDDLNSESVQSDGSNFLVLLGGVELPVKRAVFYEDLPRSVYVELQDEMGPADRPDVQVVRAVQDVAENDLLATAKTATAADDISPNLAVEIKGDGLDRNFAMAEITVTVTSNEASQNPTRTTGIVVRKVTGSVGEKVVLGDPITAADFDEVNVGRQWTWTFDFEVDDFDTEAADPEFGAMFSVSVEIEDDAGNVSTHGNAGNAGDEVAVANVFEVDVGIEDVALDPATTDNKDTFIRLGFVFESGEYAEDSHNTVTVQSVALTLEGEDTERLVTFNTIDDITFTVSPQNLPEGAHEIKVVATDEAGNETTFTKAITVETRAPFEFILQPGWNLISLPGDPVSTDINDVIPQGHPINEVRTYSASHAGFLVAIRDPADGLFAGTLATVGSHTAYLVRTTTFEPLEVLIPRRTPGEKMTPPTVDVLEGWNQVGVIDVTGEMDWGDKVDASKYLKGVDVARVYRLDRDTGNLVTVALDGAVAADGSPADGSSLKIGQGYWIYFTENGKLVP